MTKVLYEQALIIDESKIHLKSNNEKAISEAISAIRWHRQQLVNYVRAHLEFKSALKPLEASPDAPEIVRIMVESSRTAEIGPMASVAGALADLGMKAMLRAGAETAVVEDGGEIAAFTSQPITISVLSSDVTLSGKIGFRVTREDCPLGVATSSSKTGHALSFGEADSVTVVAASASLADVAATAVCNSVVGRDVDESIRLGLEKAKTIEGVRGIMIVREGRTGLWGRLPEIVKLK
ncbi:MAG: UPF0280 family protein [Candidatus Bathyarchaeota archaeon]|nr:UPF0280 family protein [Candidatus Bathyarchaeota archaeon]